MAGLIPATGGFVPQGEALQVACELVTASRNPAAPGYAEARLPRKKFSFLFIFSGFLSSHASQNKKERKKCKSFLLFSSSLLRDASKGLRRRRAESTNFSFSRRCFKGNPKKMLYWMQTIVKKLLKIDEIKILTKLEFC